MDAVLVHGLGRTPASMALLALRLRRVGFRPHVFGYAAALESFDRVAARLAGRIDRLPGEWVGVGHSLGGLLLRAAVERAKRPTHLLLLGSPARPPRLAMRFRRRLWYRAWGGDCGQLLADARRMTAVPVPAVPVTLVTGTAGWYGGTSPFGTETNDGVVAESEAVFDGATLVRLPLMHTLMMNSRHVVPLLGLPHSKS